MGNAMTQPLRKRDSSGKLYERPAEIEAAIDIAIQQDLERLKKRGAVSDKKSPEFLRSECLVHLIRSARRQGNDEIVNALLAILLRRCAVHLKGKIPDGSRPNAQDIREEILSRFSELFAEHGEGDHVDELDFYECRFNRALRSPGEPAREPRSI